MAVMYLDIETSSKHANEGMVITIGLLMKGEPEIRFALTLQEERKALEWLRERLEGCDKLVTWYGSGFDIPFLLTRAVVHEVDLSLLAEVPMLDLCEWSRANLSFSSYSLESVARFLGISGRRGFKEFRGPDILTLFKLVERGDSEAQERILEHCKEDLRVLKLIYERLKPLVERSGWGLAKLTKEKKKQYEYEERGKVASARS
jgi:uncharacterized protein YprB with RNaseH-like and TPR domain